MGNGARPTGTTTKAGQRELRAPRSFKAGASENFIKESAVRSWTRGNAEGVPAIAYHYGSEAHIARLGRDGIDVTRNFMGYYGRGFYLFPDKPAQAYSREFGDHAVRVAVHMQHPAYFDAEGFRAFEDKVAREYPATKPYSAERAHAITQTLQRMGYDGMVYDDVNPHAPLSENGGQVLAFRPGSVRVIQ